jgi:hypothetical protein
VEKKEIQQEKSSKKSDKSAKKKETSKSSGKSKKASKGSSSEESSASSKESKKGNPNERKSDKDKKASSQSGEGDGASKKRKAESDANEDGMQPPTKKSKPSSAKSSTTDKTTPQRFQRIDPNTIAIGHDRLKDNSYFAHAEATGESWGLKAAQDLIQVQGDRFRHEKTKKKRGSYKGGNISFGVNSVKLTDSDDDNM